jgi:peptidoglycan/LPS O-acetylase OafA/YrhL
VSTDILRHDEFRKRNYFAALDGLRAASVLLVLVYHVNSTLWHFMSGAEGVSIFFVISGFIITTMCLREEARDGRVSIPGFYIRRAARIFPLYFVVLGFYVVWVGILNWHGGRHLLFKSLPYYFTYLNDFSPYILTLKAPFTLSWSLGVEEKFYLVWPAIAFVVFFGRTRARFAVAALLAALALVINDGATFPQYLPYSRIMVGCLLALCLHYRRSYAPVMAVARHWWLVLGAFLAVHGMLFEHWSRFIDLAYAPVVALLIASFVAARPPWARLLDNRVMVYIGKRSYAVYLIQMICLSVIVSVATRMFGVEVNSADEPIGSTAWEASLAILVVGTGASLAGAEILFRTVERPMIRRGRLWTERLTGRTPITPPRLAAAPDEVAPPTHAAGYESRPDAAGKEEEKKIAPLPLNAHSIRGGTPLGDTRPG